MFVRAMVVPRATLLDSIGHAGLVDMQFRASQDIFSFPQNPIIKGILEAVIGCEINNISRFARAIQQPTQDHNGIQNHQHYCLRSLCVVPLV
jgi:hypothetical protein